MTAFYYTVFLMVLTVFPSGQVAFCTKGSGSLYGYLIQAGIASKSLDEMCKKSEKEIQSLKCALAKVQAKLNAKQAGTGACTQTLEDRLDSLNISCQSIKEKCEKSQQEMATLRRTLTEVQAKLNAKSGWNLVRINQALSQLNKLRVKLGKPTFIQRLPKVLPSNTKVIIISVFTNFWNVRGHLYLNFKTYQKGNERKGSVSVVNQHYNIYANTFYYELMLPWDTSLSNDLVFVVTDSLIRGGNSNYFQVKLVGYVTV